MMPSQLRPAAFDNSSLLQVRVFCGRHRSANFAVNMRGVYAMDSATFDPQGVHRIAGHFVKQSAEDHAATRSNTPRKIPQKSYTGE